MKQLTVDLRYQAADLRNLASLSLPIRVLDAEGALLAQGSASVTAPAHFDLPLDTSLAFVRLTWPSNRTESQRVDFQNSNAQTVVFDDSHLAPNEWSAWAIPRLNPNTPLAMPMGRVDLELHRFDQVWLRLWSFLAEQNSWQQETLQPSETFRNASAWQLTFASLAARPWLLQVGGADVTCRFVSLPGGGPARVLLTPKDSADPRADELKLIVTGFRGDAETLLEFMARDSLRAMGALGTTESLRTQLLQQEGDAISAVAAAYYMLRVDECDRVPLAWFETLSQNNRWLPDAAIVHCLRLLRAGKLASHSPFQAIDLFVDSLGRGWPLFSEGITLLQEAAGSLRGKYADSHDPTLERVRALSSARAWAGSFASFYGHHPDEPSMFPGVAQPAVPHALANTGDFTLGMIS